MFEFFWHFGAFTHFGASCFGFFGFFWDLPYKMALVPTIFWDLPYKIGFTLGFL